MQFQEDADKVVAAVQDDYVKILMEEQEHGLPLRVYEGTDERKYFYQDGFVMEIGKVV